MIDIEYVKSNVKEGWMLNPNEKVVASIIKRLNQNDGDCPCANRSKELQCPCSGYRLDNKCCCNLYVKIQ